MSAQLYTVEQAAQRLNTTPRFIRRLIAERRITFTRLGRHGDRLDEVADTLDVAVTAAGVYRMCTETKIVALPAAR